MKKLRISLLLIALVLVVLLAGKIVITAQAAFYAAMSEGQYVWFLNDDGWPWRITFLDRSPLSVCHFELAYLYEGQIYVYDTSTVAVGAPIWESGALPEITCEGNPTYYLRATSNRKQLYVWYQYIYLPLAFVDGWMADPTPMPDPNPYPMSGEGLLQSLEVYPMPSELDQ